jgi:DNA-binding NarL/FixJ family response regulator
MEIAERVLRLVADAASDRRDAARAEVTRLLERDLTDADRARAHVALAFIDYLDGRFAAAVVGAEQAIDFAHRSQRSEPLILASSMRVMVSAGPTWAGDDAVDHVGIVMGMRSILPSLEVESRTLIDQLLAEGLLATGRLSEAAEIHERLGDPWTTRSADDEARLPYPPFMLIQRARVLLFQGNMREAALVVDDANARARRLGNRQCLALGEAFQGLILAHLDDRTGTRAAAARTERDVPRPRGLLETGAWIVGAFALFAIGDRDEAASFVLTAGGDDELSHLQLIDRSLGYDILVAAALDRGDLSEAERWGELALPLAVNPAATLVVEQSIARLDAARGLALSAAERAQVVAARARITGRYLDAARADLVQAKALVAAGRSDLAIANLTTLAHDAELTGVPLLQRSAARELRRLGRRVPPRRGSGWTGLSAREQQIAALAAEGFSNRVIGSTLFLSERTVQSYISRILLALEITTRSGLPAIVPTSTVSKTRGPVTDEDAPLTPRQYEVAELVARGLPNSAVAAELGISKKTAEKHIGEILRRWGLTSRTGIAHVMAAHPRRRAS